MAADFKSRRSEVLESDVEALRQSQESMRREHGIDALADDEELIDDQTFDQMQDLMARAREWAEGGPPLGAAASSNTEDRRALLFDEVADGLGIPGSPPPASPEDVAALEAEILEAPYRDAVVARAMRLARAHANAVALFIVDGGVVAGLRGRGAGLELCTEGILIPPEADSVIGEVARRGAPRWLRELREADEQVIEVLGRSDARDRVLIPIAIRGRVVNLLYADNGPDALGATSAAALCALAKLVADAYVHLIVKAKRSPRT